MGNHPRILNLLLIFVLVSLSSVAVLLASDILSSGSHAVQKDGFGGLLQQIPKNPLAALNFWQDAGKIANQAPARTSGLNGSNKTQEEAALAGNASQPAPAVSSNSSLDGSSLALQQASGTTTSNITGSTNRSSMPVTKRNHSSGGQSKKASGTDSSTTGAPSNDSPSNISQLNGSQENESQANDSQSVLAPFIEPPQNRSLLNASQPDGSQANKSEPTNQSQINDSSSNETQLIEPSQQNQSSLNASQPDRSLTNRSESTDRSQMNDSLSNETQLSQEDTTNQSQQNDLQPVLTEPENQTQPAASYPDQSKTLTTSRSEIRTAPSAGATGSDDSKSSYLPAPDNASNPSVSSWVSSSAQSQRRTTSAALSPSNSKPKVGDVSLEPAAKESNPPEALTAHQEETVVKTDEGASLQGELQNKSQAESSPMTNQTLPDSSSSTATGTDAGKGSDTPAAKTLTFDSAQEKNNDKVSTDSSGKGDKAVSASESSAKIQNAKKEGATNQYKPIRAPRKPAQPRQVRSASRR